ncbi:MAG: UDP-N-acetylmuramoyl-L-alanyl-D-glutamate--2,6-diaminopimelate ligase [Deltaproteobacteria bacterium]|nr:UDP-N-acetylmuramoyl-L-alanyl-D-glutamate--2,6-diaminopimelate ligase [Deltaproteobacteria bacterium]
MHDRVKASDMILNKLTVGVKVKKLLGSESVRILGITHDSSQVSEGYLFAAIKGESTDGHRFIGQAVNRGAKALLVENINGPHFKDVSVILVEDTRSSLAQISSNFYSHPTKELKLVGITGTNGKTTTTYLLESILHQEKKNVGLIGTVEHRYHGRRIISNMTTPESIDLMALLRDMLKSGVEYVVMEVSSHALDKKRVLGCHFDTAVFTNLSQDHLDYHKTLDNYFMTKKSLFTEVLKRSDKRPISSVINVDDPYGRKIIGDSAGKIISYSIEDKHATVFADEVKLTNQGITSQLRTPWGKIDIKSNLLGKHNFSNILAATAAALSLGVSSNSIAMGVSSLSSIPGRLERVDNTFGITIVVDYAHTPDALKNVLQVVRSLTKGNLILVFGCGGDRDPIKRPIMGRIGRELSDTLIVTSDNPRTESPEKIIEEIENGVFEEGFREKRYFRIIDRRSAIEKAIEIASEGDSVLIAGKGHEDYQIVGKEKNPFDDREVAKIKIKEMTG